ncbi:uncharacterized protein CXQ87_002719 [Candidozyma duobushaemuli]|uniref:Uncharacterized protein n=1 Tax=Candidozyma duobushaemuli TaxID=1231522 RepID=A0A2V1AA71_9ASCO|nr:uncharacterized protein CXQ87_002719 [[Candida] duobushaemulonis]PVH14575.1 hypothetical protein CXQ87_002719 [[Candida] duobushaemulonis]
MQLLTIQKEVLDILKEVESGESQEDQFWIAVRDSSDEDHSTYGDVRVLQGSKGALLECDNFTVTKNGSNSIFIDPPGRGCTLPSLSIDIRSVSAVALTKSTRNLIVGTEQGHLKRFDTESKKETNEVKDAHFSEVKLLRTFPSDKVLLSVGGDFQIKLWDIDLAEDKPARTFRHQQKAITDVALIGSGRNFVSTSEDGSTVLWECGSGQVVSTFLRIDDHNDPALCVAVSVTKDPINSSDVVSGERLYECDDKVMYVGYQSGIIQEFRIASHSQSSANDSVGIPDESTLVAGYSDGTIVVWDRDAQTPMHKEVFNPSFSISNMTIRSTNTLVFDNGPESLLTMDLESYKVGQLVGLTEAFNVKSIAAVDKTVVVATGDEIAHF